jgi:hypothetical protein
MSAVRGKPEIAEASQIDVNDPKRRLACVELLSYPDFMRIASGAADYCDTPRLLFFDR